VSQQSTVPPLPVRSLTPTIDPRLVELVLLGLLMILLVAQLLSYPPTDDADRDGYVAYANHLLANGSRLPDSRLLPAYPWFLSIASKVTGVPPARAAYWTQIVLTVAFVAVTWRAIRRLTGPFIALLFLGIVAAPSYFARMAVVVHPDALLMIVFVPVLLATTWWILALERPGGWLWLAPIGIGLYVLQALHPRMSILALLLVPALAVGLLVERSFQPLMAKTKLMPATYRALSLMVVGLMAFGAVDGLLDTGARAFVGATAQYRVVTFLSPGATSVADQRIEAAKLRFREVEGQPIERARFMSYQTFSLPNELPIEDVRAVWRERLRSHPFQYALSVLNDLRLGHYFVARPFVPFFPNLDRVPIFRAPYPPDDGSLRSTLFRWTGLSVLEQEPYPANYPLQIETLYALIRVVAVWTLVAIGLWQVSVQSRGITVAIVTLFGLYVLVTAATSTIDARDVLPFVTLIYLAEAVGLAWLAQLLVRVGSDTWNWRD
jgi:hypothetical protein